MSTFAQLLLVVVICTLTFLIAMAGIQVFHLLHELRIAAKKLNQLLDRPVSTASLLQDLMTRKIPDDHVIPPTRHEPPAIDNPPLSSTRRFFKKSGSSLRS